MPGRKPVIGALLAVGVAYGVYPYVDLYRLGQAIRKVTRPGWRSMVNWSSVREGIKEDICDLVIDQPPEAQDGGQASAVRRRICARHRQQCVDRQVTPEALVAAAQDPNDGAEATRGAAVQVSWAFFAGPAAFLVDLNAPGQAAPIRLQMDLRNGSWQVTRVWLPPELLGQANART